MAGNLQYKTDQCIADVTKYLRRTTNGPIVEYLISGVTFLPNGDDNLRVPHLSYVARSLNGNVEPWFQDVINECSQLNLIKQVEREAPCVKGKNGLRFYVNDISLKCRTADDEMYSKYEILWKNIPRGLSLLTMRDENGENVTVDCVVYALKKFTGTTPEDDDDDPTKFPKENHSDVTLYFLQGVLQSAKIVSTEKVNGEAAHVSGRFINNEFYLIAGSKNVHLVYQCEQDVDLYTDDRYTIARRIAFAFLCQWRKMTHFTRTWLQMFLHHTRTTLVCEIKLPDHQHVVPFTTLDHDELVVIALTPPPQKVVESLTALPTESALQFFGMLGFSVPKYECAGYADFKALCQKTRTAKNTEGVVCYHEDHEGNTIGILKLKSKWYIHLRALRQQAAQRYAVKRNPKKIKSLEEAKEKSRRRMEELREWLQTTREELSAWQALSDLWIEWLEVHVGSAYFEPTQIRDNFPAVFGPFSSSSLQVSQTLQRLHIDNYSSCIENYY